jgi:hypothetical protein
MAQPHVTVSVDLPPDAQREPIDAFLREAAARGVDAIDYDIDDFRREIGRAS